MEKAHKYGQLLFMIEHDGHASKLVASIIF